MIHTLHPAVTNLRLLRLMDAARLIGKFHGTERFRFERMRGPESHLIKRGGS